MNELNAEQIDTLLRAAPPGATVYLIGAGGCGVSGLGHLLLDLGFQVAGSDLQVNLEVLQLRERGAVIHRGHAAAQVTAAQPVLVIYSPAIRPDNPELLQARALGVPVARRGRALAALARRQRGVCVAGMHGKTTTSALLAFALERLGAAPSYAIGWLVPQLAPHARFAPAAAGPLPPLFVMETDESDGTLREYHPQIAVVLNVDAEHLDYFASLEAVCREFQAFGGRTEGSLFYCADDEQLRALFAGHPRAFSFGYHPLADFRVETTFCQPPARPTDARPAPGDASSCFEIWHDRRRLGRFTLALPGEKNVSNAAAVIGLLHQLGYPADQIAPAIAAFRGAARRQQQLYRDERFAVYDDYGHHPNEIRATLRALKSLAPRRLLVAFQPHRYTRTRDLLAEFATCFAEADRLWLMDIYPASEPPIPGVTSDRLAREIEAQGQHVERASDLNDLRRRVHAALQPGDLALFLGAGADITLAAQALAAQLRTQAERGPAARELPPPAAARPPIAPETLLRSTALMRAERAGFYLETIS